MIEFLELENFPAGSKLPDNLAVGTFKISTCQRSLTLKFSEKTHSANSVSGQDAYFYLLEIICGLKSKLIGENEIVGQFKTAYQEYLTDPHRSPRLLQILEKLFKDAKEIRRKYLIGICQKTYSSITRRNIMQINTNDPVVIIGSGNLAEDLINQFKKKTTVIICARNKEKIEELAQNHDFTVIPWEDKETLKKYPFIANTVGTEKILFDQDFFQTWSNEHTNKMFVDLASPSPIQTDLELKDGVMHLEDVFNEGAVRESKKRSQVETARQAIKDITIKRHRVFKEKQRSDSEFKNRQYEKKIANF